jgi:hypothetical protein
MLAAGHFWRTQLSLIVYFRHGKWFSEVLTTLKVANFFNLKRFRRDLLNRKREKMITLAGQHFDLKN